MTNIDELTLLVISLTGIAVITLSIAYVMYWFQLMRWLYSLRWALLTVMLLTIMLIFLNVWITTKLMFISTIDFRIATMLFVFAGLVALVFGFLISNSMIESIRDMNRVATTLSEGDLSVRMIVHGNDELAHFALTFNMMAERLMSMEKERLELEQTRKNLIAWTSHDLRTPLTAIRVMVEAMNDKVVVDPATMTRYFANVQSEIENLSRLIDMLLEMAQLDAGYLLLKRENSSLRDLISDTLGAMTVRASQHNVALQDQVDPTIDSVYMAADKIQRVLNNLLDNAIRYTPRNGVVRLKAWLEGDIVKVRVQNTVDTADMPDISRFFTHFYRAEEARAQTKDGYRGVGLGLAIARGFVEAHDGSIKAEMTTDHEIAITFSLPRHANGTRS